MKSPFHEFIRMFAYSLKKCSKLLICFLLFGNLLSCDNPSYSNAKSSPNSHENAAKSNPNGDRDSNDDSNQSDDYPDGSYCAEIDYYNPNTGTSSSYTLLIDIESHELLDIKFPGGGRLDRHHFDNVEIDNNGNAEFESDKGYEYKVHISGPSENCFANVRAPVQCRGITKKGARCRHLTDNPDGLCWQHKKQQ